MIIISYVNEVFYYNGNHNRFLYVNVFEIIKELK
jgi:hypothetical protein